MTSGGSSLLKYLLFGFNFLFVVSGIALVVIGSLIYSDVGGYGHLLEDKVTAPPIILIVVGIIIFIVAFLGCCGAIQENKVMLIVFSAILVIILILEIVAGAMALSSEDDFYYNLKRSLIQSFNQYNVDSRNQEAWNNLQITMKCCGIMTAGDWGRLGRDIPQSCCGQGASPCTLSNPLSYYHIGCYPQLKRFFADNRIIIGAVGISFIVIEILGIVFAAILITRIQKDNNYGTKKGANLTNEVWGSPNKD